MECFKKSEENHVMKFKAHAKNLLKQAMMNYIKAKRATQLLCGPSNRQRW